MYSVQLDIDECAELGHNCHSNADCTNTDGSFMCMCNYGYTGDGTNCTSKVSVLLWCTEY